MASQPSKMTPEQIEFIKSQAPRASNVWGAAKLPDGRAIQIKAMVRNGIVYYAIALPQRLKFEGRDAGSATDYFSLNSRTGMLTQRR